MEHLLSQSSADRATACGHGNVKFDATMLLFARMLLEKPDLIPVIEVNRYLRSGLAVIPTHDNKR